MTAAATHLTIIIDHLIATVATLVGGGVHPRRIEPPLTLLLHRRLSLIARRFARLATLFATGRLPGPRRPGTPHAPPAGPRPRFPYRLRGTHAWLVRHAPGTGAYATQLEAFLARPDTRRLLAAAPQARSLLRPLARMLGVTLPQPEPQSEPARSTAHPPAPPSAAPPRTRPQNFQSPEMPSRLCASISLLFRIV